MINREFGQFSQHHKFWRRVESDRKHLTDSSTGPLRASVVYYAIGILGGNLSGSVCINTNVVINANRWNSPCIP